jgi:ParB family transcriptional regulator, chromosome partitioning protein
VPPRNFMKRAQPQVDDAAGALAELLTVSPLPVRSADLPLDRIRPNPFQARRTFGDLEPLAQVIRAQGFTSRLRVRPDPQAAGFFQLVYGERRWRAAQLAGLSALPCDIADHSDDDLIEIGLAENIQRQELDPLDEARAMQHFIDQRGYSVRRLSERLGKDRGYVENRLALLRLPDDVQQLVAQRPDTIDAARRIGTLPDPADRATLIAQVASGEVNAKTVRTIVREHTRRAGERGPGNVRRRIAADAQVVDTVLQRWEGLVQEEDAGAIREAVAEQLDGLEARLRLLRDLLGAA